MEKLSVKQQKQIYHQYIKLQAWFLVKKKYKRDHCELCNSTTKLTLHHLSYKNLTKETDDDVSTLCWLCHRAFHIQLTKDKRLRTPSKSFAKLIHRKRLGKKITIDRYADFLRRRYVVKNPYKKKLPDFNHFRRQAKHQFMQYHHKPKTFNPITSKQRMIKKIDRKYGMFAWKVKEVLNITA